jgi:hypothetical protein
VLIKNHFSTNSQLYKDKGDKIAIKGKSRPEEMIAIDIFSGID